MEPLISEAQITSKEDMQILSISLHLVMLSCKCTWPRKTNNVRGNIEQVSNQDHNDIQSLQFERYTCVPFNFRIQLDFWLVNKQ